MRIAAAALAALMLSACAQESERAAGCALSATHRLTWSNPDAPDTVTTTSEGPTCVQAVVTWVARNAEGDPLWVHAGTYYDLAVGGAAPPDAAAVSEADVQRFLAAWADATEMRSSELPEWREGMSRPGEGVAPLGYETPFERETYENLRQSDLPIVCYAAAVAASRCLIVDPASREPALIVAFGS